MNVLLCYLLVILSINLSEQHGYLEVPPSRSSLWREGFDSPVNYNDNELYCGGRAKIQELEGLCGVCGDPHDGPHENEAGGKYANGIIGRRYELGIPYIQTTVQLTAYHKGFFEFRICPHNNPNEPVKQECLDRYQLQIAESENDLEGAKLKYYPPSPGEYNLTVVLPVGIQCTQCVIQWRYKTGNSWGVDKDGTGCTGCGIQEEFRNCADIGIGGDDDNVNLMTSNSFNSKAFDKDGKSLSSTASLDQLAASNATNLITSTSITTSEQVPIAATKRMQKEPNTGKTHYKSDTPINNKKRNEHADKVMPHHDLVNRIMKTLPNYLSPDDERDKSNLIKSFITIVSEAIRNKKTEGISRSIKIDHKDLHSIQSSLDDDIYKNVSYKRLLYNSIGNMTERNQVVGRLWKKENKYDDFNVTSSNTGENLTERKLVVSDIWKTENKYANINATLPTIENGAKIGNRKEKLKIDKAFKSPINSSMNVYGKKEKIKKMKSDLKQRYNSLRKSRLINTINRHINILRHDATDWRKIKNTTEQAQKSGLDQRYDVTELDGYNKIAEVYKSSRLKPLKKQGNDHVLWDKEHNYVHNNLLEAPSETEIGRELGFYPYFRKSRYFST